MTFEMIFLNNDAKGTSHALVQGERRVRQVLGTDDVRFDAIKLVPETN